MDGNSIKNKEIDMKIASYMQGTEGPPTCKEGKVRRQKVKLSLYLIY
jgi:hypothetical protein